MAHDPHPLCHPDRLCRLERPPGGGPFLGSQPVAAEGIPPSGTQEGCRSCATGRDSQAECGEVPCGIPVARLIRPAPPAAGMWLYCAPPASAGIRSVIETFCD